MEILSPLNLEQQKAVQATSGPVLVLAGAGSGKTRTLTHRIAYLIVRHGVSPHSILAVTFTNKAAGEMKERVRVLLAKIKSASQPRFFQHDQPMIGTFHAISARILREDAQRLGFTPRFSIFDVADQKRAMKAVLQEMRLPQKEYNPRVLLYFIERAKQQLISPKQLDEGMLSEIEPPLCDILPEVYLKYQLYLKRNNALDFGDLLFYSSVLFKDHEDVLRKYQKRWQYVLVDEYQDTNHSQYVWCQFLSAQHKNLFVVGDDYQSIYSFRGANLQNILDFSRDYKDARVFVLEQNYRSTKNILNFANDLIEKNEGQQKKVLWTNNEAGVLPKIVEVADERMEAQYILSFIAGAGGTGDPHNDGENNDIEYEYEDDESGEGILDRVLQARRNNKHFLKRSFQKTWLHPFKPEEVRSKDLNSYVVLYRTNAQSRAVEEVLLEYGMPYRIIGGMKFYERKEIKDIIAYLRLIHNAHDYVSLERVLNVPGRGIGTKTQRTFIAYAQKNADDLHFVFKACAQENPRDLPPQVYRKVKLFSTEMNTIIKEAETLFVPALIDFIVEKVQYEDYLKETDENYNERIENINELKTVAQKSQTAQGLEGVRQLLEEIALLTDTDTLETANSAITLMTAHAAKGLEYDHVFLIGMEQGLFPHQASLLLRHEVAEERRLCYVAATRAKKSLHFLYARSRSIYGKLTFPEPSEFISEVPKGRAEKIVV